MSAHQTHPPAESEVINRELETSTSSFEGFVHNTFGNRYLHSVNRHTFDRLGATATLDAAFRALLNKEDTLYIIAGTDSGLLYKYVRGMNRPEGSRYLFVEPTDIWHILDDDGQFSDENEFIHCVPFEEWLESAKAFKIEDYLYLDNVEVIFSLAAQEQHHPQYTTMAWEIRDEVHKLRWQVHAQLGNEAFGICQLLNSPENIQSSHLIKNLFKGHTAVILAGGPSLDDILPWVIQYREHLAVLAVSRIAKRLNQVGIVPDFVISVDPQEISYDVSKPMLELDERTTFINQFHVAPRLLAQWPNRSLYLGNLLPWKSKLNPVSPLNTPGPTVTNSALQFAYALGFQNIILGGVDLCFTPEGYTHAQGSNERIAGPRFDLTGLEVETNAGTKASTTPDYFTAIHSLAAQARQLVASGCMLFNPAPGAARIEDVQHVPLDALPINPEPLDVPSILERTLPPVLSADRKRHYTALEREFSRILHQLSKMHKLIHEALEINETMFGVHGLIEDPAQKLKLDRIEKQLNRQYRHLSTIVKGYSLREMLRALRPFADYDQLNANEAQSMGRDYYQAYLAGAKRLSALIERAMDLLQIRIKEEDPQVDIHDLAQKWREHRQPGRVRVWQKRHPERVIQLGSNEQALLKELESEFRDDINLTETGHMKLARLHADLGAARVRALQLFARKKVDDLESLLAALKKHHTNDQGLPYTTLVEGYVHELKGEMDLAIERYSQVLQYDNTHLSEDALLRITDWALTHGKVEHALQGLQCLAAISDSYTLQYAEMLRMAGNPLEAVEVYQKHINRFPEDIQAKLRLARHLIDHRAYEGARLVLDELLADQAEDEGVKGVRRMLLEAQQSNPH